jgi:hypothetical protein
VRVGRQGKRGKTGRRRSLPQGGTPAAAHGNRGAARQRWQLRCGGEGSGAARVCEARGSGYRCCGIKGTGRRLYRAAEGLDTTQRRPCRVVAGLGLEPESSSRSGMTPTSRPRLSARERRGGESGRTGGPSG